MLLQKSSEQTGLIPSEEVALWSHTTHLSIAMSPQSQTSSQHHYHLRNITRENTKRKNKREKLLSYCSADYCIITGEEMGASMF